MNDAPKVSQWTEDRPTSCWVLNLRYRVDWIPKEDAGTGSNRFGWVDNNEQRIVVSNDIPQQKAMETFLHEIMHAIWWNMDLSDAEAKQEDAVVRLSKGLMVFWSANPEIATWWFRNAVRSDGRPIIGTREGLRMAIERECRYGDPLIGDKSKWHKVGYFASPEMLPEGWRWIE